MSGSNRELLEFVASITNGRVRSQADEQSYREFLAAVSPRHAHLARREPNPFVKRDHDAFAPDQGRAFAEGEWDSAKHPRTGGPPNAGWFAPTGDASTKTTNFSGPITGSESSTNYDRLSRYSQPPEAREPLVQSKGTSDSASLSPGRADPPSALFAIDGTGSKDFREKEGGYDNDSKRHRSHVRNFYDDQQLQPGDQKFYWDGPNETLGGDTPAIAQGVKAKIDEVRKENPDTQINLVGHSRGGYVTMELARQLKAEGAKVNFLGMYDAVDSAPSYGQAETIPSNVQHSAHAMGSNVVGSQPYFNTADHGPEDKRGDHQVGYFVATHAGLGGAPWNGDHPRGMQKGIDERESIRADQWMRARAAKVGVSLKPNPTYPFGPKEAQECVGYSLSSYGWR